MATYVFGGYAASDLLVLGGGTPGVGSQFMLDPAFAASTDKLTFTVTDDDGTFNGSAAGALDGTQTAVVKNAAGTTIASGAVRLTAGGTFTDPVLGTITVYEVSVGGVVTGYVSNKQLEPGVTYQVATSFDPTGATQPLYSSIATPTQDPTLADTIVGGAYADSILGAGGNDSITTNGGNDTVSGGAGNDTVYLGDGDDSFGGWDGEAGGDIVYGGTGNDILIGGADNDQLWGEAGADTLSGGAGDDNLSGGAGDDIFWISDDHNYDAIDGGTEFDVVYASNYISTAGIVVSFNGTGSGSYDYVGLNNATGVFNNIEGFGGTDYADTLNASVDAGGIDLYGWGGNDSLTGGSGDDWLEGGDGNDTLTGNLGWDELNGGAGADYMSGGADGDIFWIDNTSGTGDTILGGETGTGNDTLSLSSTSPNFGVSVTMTGAEAGSYAYSGGVASGTFSQIEVVWLTQGNDTLNASALSTGGTYSGGDGNDSMLGGSGADTLSGDAGDDTLSGGLGNDSLFGGTGADSLLGGAGADTLYGGDGNDWLIGGTGNDSMSGDEGADYFLVTSGDGVDTIVGGETGYDYDMLDFDTTAGGPGVSVTFSGSEAGSYTFGNGTQGTFSQIEAVYGTTANDTINAALAGSGVTMTGGGGDDLLIGGAGDDHFNGDEGNDTVIGGAGNDTLNGDTGNDSLDGGDGNDWLLGFDGDNTMLGGAGDDYFNGTSGSNLVDGGSGADSIQLGSGNDTITGGTGNDTISTGAGADVLAFDTGSGADLVTDFDLTMVGGLTVDQFDVSGLLDGSGNPVDAWDVVVGDDGAGNAVLFFPGGESVTLQGVSPAAVASVPTLHAMGIPCYAEGTLIATPQGPRPVEGLRRGDLVNTLDEGAQPVLWASRREPTPGELRRRANLRPIEIRSGVLGNDRPLRVSAQHALWVPEGQGGALARAGHLAQADGRFARHMLGCRRVVWHHLLLPRHALICAEGVWAESLWPGPMAMAALSAADRLALLAQMPHLAPGLLGLAPVEAVYGPMARRMLLRRAVTAAAFSRWSQWHREVSLLAG